MYIMIITTSVNFRVPHITWTNRSTKHITTTSWLTKVPGQTKTLKCTKSETEDTKDHHDSGSPNNNFDSISDSE